MHFQKDKNNDGRFYRSFGSSIDVDTEGMPSVQDVNGIWIDQTTLHPSEKAKLNATVSLLQNAPRWKFLQGFDVDVFQPDPHQWLVADCFAQPWMRGCLGSTNGIERNHILIADEGGTGKTLSATIGARWVYVHHPGTILVLCPPLLVQTWYEHFCGVFSDVIEKIVVLKSARELDPKIHTDKIVIVSKYSLVFHWNSQNLQKTLNDLKVKLTIIDEVHQGRTGGGDFPGAKGSVSEIEDESILEENELIQEIEELLNRDQLKTQYELFHLACQQSDFVVGLSATPVNLAAEELWTVLYAINAPISQFVTQENFISELQKSELWNEALRKLKLEAVKAPANSLVGKEAFETLTLLFKNKLYPRIWIEEPILLLSIEGYLNQCTQSGGVIPATALRLCRELSPLGQVMLLTLRDDLSTKVAQQFRTRCEQTIWVPMPEQMKKLVSGQVKAPLLSNGKPVFTSGANGQQPMTIAARICTSHIRNTNAYPSLNWDSVPTGLVNQPDPRAAKLLELLRPSIKKSNGERSRPTDSESKGLTGAVVFIEFRYSIKCIQYDLETLAAETGDNISVHILTGDTSTEQAQGILRACEFEAQSSQDKFPILLCTSAAEVGLSMAWATYLVHWDPHMNPQRMEQRTWRVDRRLNRPEYSKQYTVYHLHFTDHPLHGRLRDIINERYDTFCESLGLRNRTYISNEGKMHTFSIGGASTAAELWAPELIEADSYIGREHIRHYAQAQSSKLYELNAWERLFVKTILTLSSNVFDNTVYVEEDGLRCKSISEAHVITLTRQDMMLSRLSVVAPNLAHQIAQSYRAWNEVPVDSESILYHWSNLLKDFGTKRILASMDYSIQRFFGRQSPVIEPTAKIPMVRVPSKLKENIHIFVVSFVLDEQYIANDEVTSYIDSNFQNRLFLQCGSDDILPFTLDVDNTTQSFVRQGIESILSGAIETIDPISIQLSKPSEFLSETKNDWVFKVNLLEEKINFLTRYQEENEDELDEFKLEKYKYALKMWNEELIKIHSMIRTIEKMGSSTVHILSIEGV